MYFWLGSRAGTSLLRPIPCQRTPAYVAPAEAAFPMDGVDGGVGSRLRLRNRHSRCSNAQNTPADGNDAAVSLLRPSVEDLDSRQTRRIVETVYDVALLIGTRITFRRHDNRQRGIVPPTHVDFLQHSVTCRDEGGEQIALEPDHQNLTLRIAEAAIVFDELRAILREHQAEIHHAHVANAL